jgi:hypothetical protein
LIAQSHEAIDAFHAAAMAAGGQDNGAPGIRPQYHSDYYAAYILGPDGVNLEAGLPAKDLIGVVRISPVKTTCWDKAPSGRPERSGIKKAI